MTSTNGFKREVDRLTFDLQQAHQEKIQAAEYGLAVLEEKQKLQEKYDELEALNDATKIELSQLKEQFDMLKSKNESLAQKIELKQGNIVHESTTRESAFASKIGDLQVDLKNSRKAERNACRENEHLKQQHALLQKEFDALQEKKEQFVYEIKDLKLKESRFNDEYNLLEEENTGLQKSISKLKQTLVEFEGLKVENKSLMDEVDSLQLQLQMTTDARNQFEKQLHEALDTVKEQRERNTQHQKDIHDLKQQSIMKTWQLGHGDIRYNNEEHPLVKQITEEYKTQQPAPSPGLVDDLMKELQFTEIRDLEEQLRTVNEEKKALMEELDKKSYSAQQVVAEASKLCRRGSSDNSEEEEGDEYTMNNQLKELSELKETVKQCRNREIVYELDLKRLNDELDEMKELVLDLENERNTLSENSKGEQKTLSTELLQAKSQLREYENIIKTQKEDLSKLKEATAEAQSSLNSTQTELKNLCSELYKLQKKLDIPNTKEVTSLLNSISDEKRPHDETASVFLKLTNHMKEQVNSIQIACEGRSSESGSEVNSDENKIGEINQLKGQLLKFQNILSTKREQIATLRTVLKANKSTYEVALGNLKSRYENDKAVQTEANNQLKRQIKALRSECQTFSSLRSMFTSRCEEYMQQLQEKEKAFQDVDEERKTLTALLKQAIHQKISLTQRLEEFELARERLRQFTKKNIKSSGKPPPPKSGQAKPVTRV